MSRRRGRGNGLGLDGPGLTAEEVERRRSGGARPTFADVRRRTVDRRDRLVRDTLTILGGALGAIVAWQVLGGGAPGPAAASMTLPDDTGVEVASVGALPTVLPLATLGPIANPSIGLGASPTPVPFVTLRPRT